mgnify:CR=1 FL=1
MLDFLIGTRMVLRLDSKGSMDPLFLTKKAGQISFASEMIVRTDSITKQKSSLKNKQVTIKLRNLNKTFIFKTFFTKVKTNENN